MASAHDVDMWPAARHDASSSAELPIHGASIRRGVEAVSVDVTSAWVTVRGQDFDIDVVQAAVNTPGHVAGAVMGTKTPAAAAD
jgi:hypothetical protein